MIRIGVKQKYAVQLFVINTILCCLFITSFSPAEFDAAAVETEKKYVEFEDLITYDIWKHSDGSWQSTGYPGAFAEFNYTSEVNIDSSKKLLGVKAEFLNVDELNNWYDMSVSSCKITTKSFDSESVVYKVECSLEANKNPLDIKQYSWQSPNVEGYRYYIPVKIIVEYEIIKPEESLEEPPMNEEDEENDDEEETDYDEKTYDVQADLMLPSESYIGHPVLLQDCSVFTDGVSTYTPYQFYKNGLGTNSFRKKSGTGNMKLFKLPKRSAGYYSDRYASFSEAGNYSVQLTAKINNGYAAVDTEYINIKPVPDVEVTVSGKQKSNRKQILNIRVALEPGCAIKRAWVEIFEKGGSNKVHLDYDPLKSKNEIDNSQLIKTREIKNINSSDYFENLYVEFLTKNEEKAELEYDVYVEDMLGRSDKINGTIMVEPDDPPEAVIKTDKYHFRNKDENLAYINIKDASLTFDDEVVRSWSIKDDGIWNSEFNYVDNSFGALNEIKHLKEGVGKVEYRLIIKDIISEDETLKEYISESDCKSAVGYGETEVINFAPVVNLTSFQYPSAKILLLTDDENYTSSEDKANNIILKLSEQGIDAQVDIQRIEGNLSDNSFFTEPRDTESPFSYNAQWTSYDNNNFIADSRMAYKVNANFGNYGGGKEGDEPDPISPYVVQAFDLKTGHLKWEKTFNESVFKIDKHFAVSQDDDEKYLFIAANEKTLILSKFDGSILGIVSADLTGDSYVFFDYIYSFTENGILKISVQTGSVEVVDSSTISGKTRILKGVINYAVNKNNSLCRGYFDMETEEIEVQELNGIEGEDSKGIEIDIYGNMGVSTYSGKDIESISIWDERNQLIKKIEADNYVDDSIIVKDEDGKFVYTGFIFNKYKKTSSGKRRYNILLKVEGIYNDFKKEYSSYSGSGYETSPRFLYSYIKNETIYLVTPGEVWYVWGRGTGEYTEKSYYYKFEKTDKASSKVKGSGNFSWIKGIDFEHAIISDESLILQRTEGNPYQNGISGSKTGFMQNGKSDDFMLNKYYNKFFGDSSDEYCAMFIMDNNSLVKKSNISEYGFYKNALRDKTQIYTVNSENSLDSCISDFSKHIFNNSNKSSERLIFSKGEKVTLKASYKDYEADPSKKSYYLYYHFPYNDGVCENVNFQINDNLNITKTFDEEPLEKPIDKFYHDGMYKVEHWQYDDTGNSYYDKKSNVAEAVFYIQGSGRTPYIKNIKEKPSPGREGESLSVDVEYDDDAKKVLSLSSKAYLDGELIKDDIKNGLKPDSEGNYPNVNIAISENALSGEYSVICKVWNEDASGIKEHSFSIVSGYNLLGSINHTPQWDINRKRYNSSLFHEEYNELSEYDLYAVQSKPRKRGTNVFWSEEKFILRANIAGNPEQVTCKLIGTDFSAVLSKSDEVDTHDNAIYNGELWNSGIKGLWGTGKPQIAEFEFTAIYPEGIIKKYKESIIIDDTDYYWRIHKIY